MNANEIMDALGEVGSFLLKVLESAIWGLYMIFSYLYTKLCDFLASINLPMLPTLSRVMYENVVSGTLLVLVGIYILFINISAFRLFNKNKKKAENIKDDPKSAKKRKYKRVSSGALFFKCLIGGALGGFVGMSIYGREKVGKALYISVLIMFIFQLLFFSYLIGFFGFWYYFT